MGSLPGELVDSPVVFETQPALRQEQALDNCAEQGAETGVGNKVEALVQQAGVP